MHRMIQTFVLDMACGMGYDEKEEGEGSCDPSGVSLETMCRLLQ